MFAMMEYPADMLPLYSQGFSLARFLIAQGGQQKFVHYVGDGLASNNWTGATQKHYGFKNLSELQVTWLDWVRQGHPPIQLPPGNESRPLVARADADQARGQPDSNAVAAIASAAHPKLVPVANGIEPSTATKASMGPLARGDWDSWYARQRQSADLRRDSSLSSAAGSGVLTAAEPVELAQAARAEGEQWRSTSRPQPLEKVRETILDWGGPAPARTATWRR
jgi:hypothetical protein